jgi:hypothetical protein
MYHGLLESIADILYCKRGEGLLEIVSPPDELIRTQLTSDMATSEASGAR